MPKNSRKMLFLDGAVFGYTKEFVYKFSPKKIENLAGVRKSVTLKKFINFENFKNFYLFKYQSAVYCLITSLDHTGSTIETHVYRVDSKKFTFLKNIRIVKNTEFAKEFELQVSRVVNLAKCRVEIEYDDEIKIFKGRLKKK